MKDVSIAVSHFAKLRQTKDSRYSYFQGSYDELISIVKQNFPLRKPDAGGREGVYIVPVKADRRFLSPVTKVHPYHFLSLEPVHYGDDCVIKPFAMSAKVVVDYADIVLWSREQLEADGHQVMGCDYEIVSINATDTPNAPEHPHEISRRIIEENAEYSARHLADSVRYWSQRVFVTQKYKPHLTPKIAKMVSDGKSNAAIRVCIDMFECSESEAINYVKRVKSYLMSQQLSE